MLLYVNRYKWVVDWIFVIVRAIPLYTTFYIVSIHLMLLFIIKMQLKKVIEYYGFNTSHITLYQIWESSCNRNTNVSIHLMLLFIGFHWRTVCCKQTVSIHLMLLFIPGYRWTSRASILFQYISCYSLSNLLIMKRYCKNMFQYISCYSLSQQTTIRTMQASVSIHLMLLFI